MIRSFRYIRKGVTAIAVTSAVLLTSCLEADTYPETPALEYKSMRVMTDSLEIITSFTDGDGDIGLNENETDPPYDTSSRFHFNYFIEYWEWNHDLGQWEQGINALGDTIVFNYRLPVITPEGKNKALKGEIDVTVEPPYYDPTSPYGDTIKYRIQLADRSLKTSDWIWTGEIWNGVVQD